MSSQLIDPIGNLPPSSSSQEFLHLLKGLQTRFEEIDEMIAPILARAIDDHTAEQLANIRTVITNSQMILTASKQLQGLSADIVRMMTLDEVVTMVCHLSVVAIWEEEIEAGLQRVKDVLAGMVGDL